MQVLVTGGTGFIGKRLVARLLKAGHRVTVLSRQNARVVRRELTSEVKPVKSLAAVNPSIAFDAIINLAGEGIMDKRWSQQRKRELLDSRVGVTNELVDLIERLENKPEVFISGSAIGIYGSSDQRFEVDEHSPAGSDFPASLCNRWEQAALRAKEQGVRVCLLRTGIVLHPEGGALREMILPFRFGLGGPLGKGQQMMSWIHMEDMVEAILFLMSSTDSHGAYNVTAPNPVSNKAFARQLGLALKRPAFIPVPTVVMKLMLGESSDMVLKGQSALPARLEEKGFQFTFPELEAALSDLLKH